MTTGEEITKHDPDNVPWRDRDWRMIKRQHTEASPLFLELNADGTATQWKASMYGPVGQTGIVSALAREKMEEITTDEDKQWLEIFITQLEESNRIATTVAKAMTNGKDKKR